MMGDAIWNLPYELLHWALAWCVPEYGIIEAHELGIKVTGARVVDLEPGGYWIHRQRTTVYKDNVKRKVREPSDVICRTRDEYTVRVGISLSFVIVNIRTWLFENEDAEAGLLLDCQRAVLKYVRRHDMEQIDKMSEEDEAQLTKFAQREMGRYFGVQIKQLGLTTFAETECRDLNHSGSAMSIEASSEGDQE